LFFHKKAHFLWQDNITEGISPGLKKILDKAFFCLRIQFFIFDKNFLKKGLILRNNRAIMSICMNQIGE